MMSSYWGYIYSGDQQVNRSALENEEQIVAFLTSNLFADQLVITDSRDTLVFHSRDGVDLYSNLAALGIDLPAIYQDLRQGVHSEKHQQTGNQDSWEDMYDRIGLSPDEIRMRQRVKDACKKARTVQDIVILLKGTYFDAFLLSEDKRRAWGYLDEAKYTAYVLDGSQETGWANERDEEILLDPEARVKHISSSEDKHWFLILDPPDWT